MKKVKGMTLKMMIHRTMLCLRTEMRKIFLLKDLLNANLHDDDEDAEVSSQHPLVVQSELNISNHVESDYDNSEDENPIQ